MKRFAYIISIFALTVCALLIWDTSGAAKTKSKNKKGIAYFNEPAIGFAAEEYDLNKDGKFSQKELAKITKLQLKDAEQSEIDLKELKYLKNLRSLEIWETYGKRRDIKNISALYKLKKIKSIRIEYCNLSKGFKTAQWKNLKKLELTNCKLKKLSLKKNVKLEHLACDENNIPSLNLTKNVKLKSFSGSLAPNQLKKLDLSKNKKITSLSLNEIGDVEFSNIKLYQNGSKLQKLEFLWTQEREEIDLTGWNLTSLKEITCTGADEDNEWYSPSHLKKVIVGDAPQLESASFSVPTLEQIQILNAFYLKELWCRGSQLKKITLSVLPVDIHYNSDSCEVEIIK